MRRIRAVMSTVLVGAVAGATLVAAPQAMGAGAAQAAAPRVSGTAFTAPSMTNPYVIGFQDRSGTLGQIGNLYSPGSLGLSVAPGTSPVVIAQPGFSYEVVYQAGDHHWAEAGDAGTVETPFVMAPGTSPAAVLSPGASNGASWQNAWQGSNGNLWAQGTDLGLAMAPNTSPSMVWLGTGYEILYQSSNHHLAQTGVFGTRDLGAVMAPGTSPVVTLSPGASNSASYQIAWQGSNGDLWAQGTDLDLAMAPNTSPSMVWLGTGYEILYQSNDNHLAQTGVFGTKKFGLMAPGSSPAVVLSPGGFGAYQIAWTGDNGDLWASDPSGGGTTDLGVRPAPNSSPSITGSLAGASVNTGQQVGYEVAFHGNADHPGVSGGFFGSGFTTTNLNFLVAKGSQPSVAAIGAHGYQIAFQDINTHEVVTTGSDGTVHTGLPMAPNTSPSIVGLPGDGYVIAFQHAGDGTLWTTSNIYGTHQVAGQMAPGTSPAAANLPNGGAFRIVWQGINNHLWTTGNRPTDLGYAMAPGTNPSLAILPNNDFAIAYQSIYGGEKVYSSDPTIISGDNAGPMWPGTSPSIAATPPSAQWPNGGFEVAYAGIDGRLYGAGTIANNPIVDAGAPDGYQVQPGTSPAILGAYLPATLVGAGNLIPGYQIAFQEANTRSTWITEASPAFTAKHTLTNVGVLMDPAASPSIANLGRS